MDTRFASPLARRLGVADDHPHPRRRFVTVSTAAQWSACEVDDVEPGTRGGTVTLARRPASPPTSTPELPERRAALGFDPLGQLYHARPEHGQLDRYPWYTLDPSVAGVRVPDPVEVFPSPGIPAADPRGAFGPIPTPAGRFSVDAVGTDRDGWTYLLMDDGMVLAVLDVWAGELVGSTVGPTFVDLAVDGSGVAWTLRADGSLAEHHGAPDAHAHPLVRAEEVTDATPTRLAMGAGMIAVLWQRPATALRPAAAIVTTWRAGERQHEPAAVLVLDGPDASDVELLAESGGPTLVVARGPATAGRLASFDRWQLAATDTWLAADPLAAPGYDGRGIARTRTQRVAYWTRPAPGAPDQASGLRLAAVRRETRASRGSVTTFWLDSGRPGNRWGRVIVDACCPATSSISVAATTTDELPASDSDAPPMGPAIRPARRSGGREAPWPSPQAEESGTTAAFEAPVVAPPGRYLQLRLELRGSDHASPEIGAVRVYLADHDWLDRLPAVYSADASSADFLDRLLAIPAGMFGELEMRALHRHLLFDPRVATAEALEWVGSLVGMALDARWPDATRRAVVEAAIPLFRARGTIGGLSRLLELYLGRPPVIVEQFRLRGLDADPDDETGTGAVLGGGFRVGHRIGGTQGPTTAPTDPDPTSQRASYAHRFSVLIPSRLDDETAEVVDRILELHRPAHTRVERCSLDGGMRAGLGTYAGVTSLVGPTGGFSAPLTGSARLGRGVLVGRPPHTNGFETAAGERCDDVLGPPARTVPTGPRPDRPGGFRRPTEGPRQ